jgi:hypothetical protein
MRVRKTNSTSLRPEFEDEDDDEYEHEARGQDRTPLVQLSGNGRSLVRASACPLTGIQGGRKLIVTVVRLLAFAYGVICLDRSVIAKRVSSEGFSVITESHV